MATTQKRGSKRSQRVVAREPEKLTIQQQAFVKEFLLDLNATQAAIRAGYSPNTANQQGSKLLANSKVAEAIQEALQERAKRTEITADEVLRRWWDIATADPRELMQYRRVNCRRCYGKDHEYQWVDEDEYKLACQREMNEAKFENRAPRIPSDAGGYGFNATLSPHAKCPTCHGEGYGDAHFEDTRTLSPQAALLFAGVKVTRQGTEIMVHDQGKALENVARHLGMFNDKLTLKGDEENPLKVLFEQVSGSKFKVKG